MEPNNQIKSFKGPATYQITVRGKVYPEFLKRLNDLSVSHADTNDEIISTLTGEIPDQEALNGLLNILFDHQYSVISVLKIQV